jgi:hypothetical protein
METLKPSVFSIIYGPTKSCPDPKREFFRSWIPLKPTEALNGAPAFVAGGAQAVATGLSARRMTSKYFILNGLWWALQDSNLRLPPCEGGTLPLS